MLCSWGLEGPYCVHEILNYSADCNLKCKTKSVAQRFNHLKKGNLRTFSLVEIIIIYRVMRSQNFRSFLLANFNLSLRPAFISHFCVSFPWKMSLSCRRYWYGKIESVCTFAPVIPYPISVFLRPGTLTHACQTGSLNSTILSGLCTVWTFEKVFSKKRWTLHICLNVFHGNGKRKSDKTKFPSKREWVSRLLRASESAFSPGYNRLPAIKTSLQRRNWINNVDVFKETEWVNIALWLCFH